MGFTRQTDHAANEATTFAGRGLFCYLEFVYLAACWVGCVLRAACCVGCVLGGLRAACWVGCVLRAAWAACWVLGELNKKTGGALTPPVFRRIGSGSGGPGHPRTGCRYRRWRERLRSPHLPGQRPAWRRSRLAWRPGQAGAGDPPTQAPAESACRTHWRHP